MPAPNFDPVARPYRFLEYGAFGPALWRRRIAFLPHLPHVENVLMAGEGDGRFLAAYAERNPRARIDYLDASPVMAALAHDRVPSANILTGNALDLPLAPQKYDLIVTHFFLDCFHANELERLIEKLSRAAKPHAAWLISDFRSPNVPARILVRGLYLFFGLTTGLTPRQLTPHAPFLESHGFRQSRFELALGRLLASELWTR